MNDRAPSPPQEQRPHRNHRLLRGVNALGAGVSAGFAVTGLTRPGFVHGTTTDQPEARFWAASSAVRGWVIAGAVLYAVLGGEGARRHAPTALNIAGLVQLGDSVLGVWQRKPDMTFAPALLAAIHLLSARHLRDASIT